MSHYSIGYTVYSHRNKQITSIVNNTEADNFITKSDYVSNSKPGNIPIEYEHRPDLIANLFLGDANSLWYLCLLSNKYDVFEDFKSGEKISLPR